MTRSISLVAEPTSASAARKFLRGAIRHASIQLTEADLLVTEVIGNVLNHSSAGEFLLEVLERTDCYRVVVSHSHDQPLTAVDPGMGFKLLDLVAARWGHGFENRALSVWFDIRTPGASSNVDDKGDDELLAELRSDPDLAGELVRRYSGLARSIARRYRGKGVAYEDLEQVAMMGLLKAIQNYDAERGELRSYAAVTISGEMKKLLRDSGWSLRVPRSMQERSLRVGVATEKLRQRLGRQPNVEEIGEATGFTTDQVYEGLMASMAYNAQSIDQPIDSDGRPMKELLGAQDSELAFAGDRAAVREAIGRLPLRQQEILQYRFFYDLTQTEIAERVGVSQMHVSRLLRRSLRDLEQELLGVSNSAE